ncbi:hypothetical protein CMO91_04650 [Candidatus Woesearchaeota archaeon]|nr:hypothetical protein [Candidatus Woesearchaeota archaeon]
MTLSIVNGTAKDVFNVLSKHRHFGQVVHPVVLYQGEHTCHLEEGSALFSQNRREGTVFIAPVGENAVNILARKCKIGSTVIRLTEEQLEKLKRFRHVEITNEYDVCSNFLPGFDSTLEGSTYKPLRKDVRTAEKAGLTFSKATVKDFASIKRLHKSWKEYMAARDKTLTDTSWISKRLRNFQGFEIYKVKKGKRLIAAAGVGLAGQNAFMDFRMSRQNKCRASAYLDYRILSRLKERGFVHLERGRSFGTALTEYKQKFHPLEIRKAYDVRVGQPKLVVATA